MTVGLIKISSRVVALQHNNNKNQNLSKSRHIQHLKNNSVKLQKSFFERVQHINSNDNYYNQVELWEDLNQLSKMIHHVNRKISEYIRIYKS